MTDIRQTPPPIDADLSDEQRRKLFRQTLHAMPGYPWLPCPICKYTGSCDHIAAERARASGISFGTEVVQ